VVAIWRDLGNSQLTLATGWNVTNTAILGVFMIVALRESWRNNHPTPACPTPGRAVPVAQTAPALPAHAAEPVSQHVLVSTATPTRKVVA
jgi:cellulose synthase (UDP-forming)